MKNIVISLTTAIGRREHIQKEFDKKEVDFQFFDALTPDLAEPLAEKMGLHYDKQYMTGGELACFMSHVSLWRKMIDENIPYMAIFEDDIYLGEDAKEFLSVDDWLQQNWDIIKLELTKFKVIINSKIPLDNERAIYTLNYPHLGSGGYIVSKNAVIKLLKYLQTVNPIQPIDHILFKNLIGDKNITTLQLVPALCVQDIILNGHNEHSVFNSTLIVKRGKRMKEEKHSLSYKIKRELLRFLSQIRYFFLSKKIKFM